MDVKRTMLDKLKIGIDHLGHRLKASANIALDAPAAAVALLVATLTLSLGLIYTGTRSSADTGRNAALQSDPGTFVILSFKPTATAADITALLQERKIEIVEGPKAGIWRGRLSHAELPPAQAEAMVVELRAANAVIFAAVAR